MNRDEVIEHIKEHGTIPAHEECPYREQCPMAHRTCVHKGYGHTVPFSCASARGYVITEKRK